MQDWDNPEMNKPVRFGCKLMKLVFRRINIFCCHWNAYVDHLEGKDDIASRFHYLGVDFLLSTVCLVGSTISVIGIFKQHAWLQDPWYRTAMFVNFLPKVIRSMATGVLVLLQPEDGAELGYELVGRQRAPTFMRY